MKKIIIQTIVLIYSTFSFAQSNIKIDSKAPEINITNWVSNIPKDKKLDDKYIVLEFWATWCGPCIAAVPHMNDLQAQINHPDLVFISITDEPINKVNRTIEKIDFKSIVVSDTTKQTQLNFGDGKSGLDAYPLTVLINNQGIIKWIGEPKQLTSDVLYDFLDNNLKGTNYFENQVVEENNTNKEGKTNSAINESMSITDEFLNIVKDKKKIFFFELRKATLKEPNSMRIGNNAILMSPITLKSIYMELFDYQINSSELVDSSEYTLLYKNMKGDENDIKELEPFILSALKIESKKTTQNITKYNIQIVDNSLLKSALETMFSSKSDADDKIIFSNFSISDMIKEMSKELKINMFYSGDDKENYDFILRKKNLEEFKVSLEEYGLSIKKIIAEEEVIELIEKE